MFIIPFIILIFLAVGGVMLVSQQNQNGKIQIQEKGNFWQKMLARIRIVPERYPLASIAAIGLCIVGFVIISQTKNALHNISFEHYTRIIMTLVTLLLVSISGEMWSRAMKHRKKIRLLIQASILVFIIIYAFLLPEYFNNIPSSFALAHTMWYLCFIMLLFVAPYITNFTSKNHNIYGHSALLISAVSIGFIFSIITFALGALLVWSLDALFSIEIKNGFAYWWVVCAALIGPIITLSYLPNSASHVLKETLPKVLQSLLQYIVIPFVVVYFIVLYVYTGKIVFLWKWPEGVVSWLIIVFSVIGWSAYAIIHPWNKLNRFFTLFSRFFPWIVIPQIIILFVALWWRVNAYGITVNRYFVALFGVWLLINAFYFVFIKNKKLIILFYTFILLTFFASFGPWGVFTVSKKSQVARLQNTLIKHQLLNTDGSINTTQNNNLDQNIQNDLISIMNYIENMYGEKILIQALPQVAKNARAAGHCQQDDCAHILQKEFNLEYKYNYIDEQNKTHINYLYENDSVTFATGQYSHAIVDIYNLYNKKSFSIDNIQYNIQKSKNSIDITKSDGVGILTIYFDDILKEAKNISNNITLNREYSNNGLVVKLIVTSINGFFDKDTLEVYNIDGIILLKAEK